MTAAGLTLVAAWGGIGEVVACNCDHEIGKLAIADDLAELRLGLEHDRRGPMQHAHDRVRELTAPDRLRWPVEQVVGDLNRFLRGWAGYFRYGNSTVQFDRIVRHAERQLQLWIGNRHEQPWSFGRKQLGAHADRYGLITLNGTVAAPRPNRPWRQGVECRR